MSGWNVHWTGTVPWPYYHCLYNFHRHLASNDATWHSQCVSHLSDQKDVWNVLQRCTFNLSQQKMHLKAIYKMYTCQISHLYRFLWLFLRLYHMASNAKKATWELKYYWYNIHVLCFLCKHTFTYIYPTELVMTCWSQCEHRRRVTHWSTEEVFIVDF